MRDEAVACPCKPRSPANAHAVEHTCAPDPSTARTLRGTAENTTAQLDGGDLLLLGHAERGATAAGSHDVGVVDLEPGALKAFLVVDRRAADELDALVVDEHLQPVGLEHDVVVALLVEGELVLKARAAAASNTDAQACAAHVGLL